MGLRVPVSLLVPLMEVEVITHLPDSLGSWGLVLYWNFCQSGRHIKLYVVCKKDIFILLINFHILVARYAVVVVACECAFLDSSQLLELAFQPFLPLVGVVHGFRGIVSLLVLLRLWRRRLCSYFYIVAGKVAFVFWLFDEMAIPPTVFEGSLDYNCIALLESQICNGLLCLLLFLLAFVFIIGCFLIIFCILDELSIM